MTAEKGPWISRTKLAKALTSLRAFQVSELGRVDHYWGDGGAGLLAAGNIAFPSSIGVLQLAGTDISFPITFPSSTVVEVTVECSIFPGSNNSAFLVALRLGGTDNATTELVPVSTGSSVGGRYIGKLILAAGAFTTATYKLSGFYSGGAGGNITANTASGRRMIISVQPLVSATAH